MAEDKRMLTQRIMREVALLYTQPTEVRRDITKGVLEMAKEARLKQKILAPRRRVTVLIVGNHSASKVRIISVLWRCVGLALAPLSTRFWG